MKRFIFFFLLIFSLGFAQNLKIDSGQSHRYEHILSFSADINIENSGRVTIKEKIMVFAAGDKIKRGIFRSLPLSRNINDKKVNIRYDIISVKRDGQEENYRTETRGSDLGIYFGNKNKILKPGVYTYELTYQTQDQIGFFQKFDEFYWNVNGNLWDFAVDEIYAKVTLPQGATILQTSCYAGEYQSQAADCAGNQLQPNVVQWSATELKPREGLTVAVGFQKGIMLPPPPPTFLEKYGVLAVLSLAALGLTAYFITSWQKYGVDPQKPVVYPQFNAPQNLSPAAVGYLDKEYYAEEMITAAIISLATKGFIKIIEDDKRILGIFGGKEYTLEKIKEAADSLPKEELSLMYKFFPGNAKVISFDGKYNSKIEYAVNDFKASLKYQHDPFLKKGNNTKKLIIPLLIIIILYSAGIFFSYKITYSDIHMGSAIPLGTGLLFLGIILSYFFERYLSVKIIFGFIAVGLIILWITVVSADSNLEMNLGFYASYAFFIFGFIALVLYQYFIKQPTPEKLEIQSLIKGFKMYLGTAEEKTLQFHNPPAMTPEVFEQMLPYAMVLGVDKIWGEKFQTMLKKSTLGAQNYQSNWFVGASIMNMNFANSLSSSLSQSIASSATQPSSSGSGSGGGGFSGGGGGGGGGGGW